MDYVLNELSISQVRNIPDARMMLEHFVKCCITTKKDLGLETLRIHESVGNLYNYMLTENYPVSKWRHDDEVNFDILEKFRQIIATPPLIKEVELKELDTFNTTYFYHDKKEAKGLGAAYLLKTIAVSFLSEQVWNNTNVSLIHEHFEESENIVKSDISVPHAATSDHVLSHKEYFEELKNSLLSKCADIWKKREELFPNLIFCGKTEKQLKTGLSSRYVHQIFDRLSALTQLE